MRIQHNIMAMNAYRNYNTNTSALSKNLEKLSSGYKINRAGDDAAGLAISEKMRAQITGLNAAQKNVKDGISLVKTAEGAMQEIQDMLNRMDYLATQSANGTYDDPVDRANLQKEVDALKTEINRIADSANFNGIKLLDGSMDEGKVTTRQAASAISDIKTSAYAPQGMSDAFSATFITNRPEGNATSVAASFTVSLDDLSINAISSSNADKVDVTLKIGDFTITTSMAGNVAYTAGQIVTALATKGGKALDAADTTHSTLGTAAGSYIKLGDVVYNMEVDAQTNTIKFTQDAKNLKALPNGHDNINPNYAVSVKVEGNSGNAVVTGDITNEKKYVNGTLDWQVQDTVTGKVPGSTRQAQVSVAIDFSKLKDGDKFTAGNQTFVFSIGKDSIYADNTKYTPKTGEKVVDLRDIFKEESDLANDSKQLDAMDKIVNTMKTTQSSAASQKAETWEAGNGGVDSGIGTITFQSLSNYVGETTNVKTDDAYIGGDEANGICDMRTEASVMKQFFASSAETSASVSFSLDASKIKVGDTVSIGGKTFEFTDGATASSKSNVAVDLSSLGVSGGLVTSQTGQVLEKLKTAINTAMPDKYTVDVDSKSNTMTIKSKDIAGTTTFENRVAAEVKLPTVSSTGKALTLQIGDTSDSFNQLKLSIGDMHVSAMGTEGGKTIADISIANQADAQAAVQTIKDAINYVSSIRGDLGATQNRLEHTSNNLSVMAENIQDAESTIRDTDVAEEMMKYTKNNILIQSAQAMLAQANAVPQGVLQLLG